MIVNTKAAFADLLSDIREHETIFLDTETTGLSRDSRICGIVVGLPDDRDFYIPVRHRTEDPQLDPAWVLPLFAKALSRRRHALVFHNAKFDLRMFAADGIDLRKGNEIHDTMILAHIADDTLKRYGLKSLGQTILGEADAADQQDFVKATIKERGYTPDLYGYAEFPVMELAPYACQDTALTRRLFYELIATVRSEGTYWTYRRELDVLPVVLDMEERGVCIDRAYCQRAVEKLERLIPEAREKLVTRLRERHIYVDAGEWRSLLGEMAAARSLPSDWPSLAAMALQFPRLKYLGPRLKKKDGQPYANAHGDPFSGSSTAFGKIMGELGIKGRLIEKTGNISYDKAVLEEYAALHPFCSDLLQYRYFEKLSSTYFKPFLERTNGQPDIAVIHPEFDQIATRTGRFSCRNPNFQNLVRPGKDDDLEIQVKRAIVPHPGYVFLPMDFKAMEMSMLAHLAGERGLIKKLREGWDAHEATAASMFPDEWEGADEAGRKELRQTAKTLNFGLIYGMGAAKLQRSLELETLEEAQELKAEYFSNMPGVRALSRQIYRQLDIQQPQGAQELLGQYAILEDEKGNRFLNTGPDYTPPVYRGPRPTLRNAFGRLYHFNVLPYLQPRVRTRPSPENPRLWTEQVQTHYAQDAHAALNYDDQGSCADLVKKQMARVAEALHDEDAFLVMQVHDELVPEVRPEEAERIARICKALMEDCPEINSPMAVDVSIAVSNWADKVPLELSELEAVMPAAAVA